MTPREKAHELIVKALVQFEKLTINEAKKIALIAVDEVISADWYIPTAEDYKKWTSYWNEVKQEIEKI